MNIPLILSGNYGEIRNAHFHTGIDIKTEQVEGKFIFAVDSGTVFRIGVHAGGYGNAIYIRHPRGSVTVYGHLSRFAPAIDSWVKDQQYQLKSFDVELYPQSGLFVFSKGGLIGYSGSSGFSGGPHLHFEIRDKSATVPLNVLKYDFQIRDTSKPRIKWLAIYPLDDSSMVNGHNRKLILRISGSNGKYFPVPGTISASGNIGFGIETNDFLDGSSNPCSPYDVRLLADDQMHLRFTLDSIPFSFSGSVDSHVDYEEKIKSGKSIRKLFIDPNNRLPIYKQAVNQGLLRFSDTLTHRISILVSDAYGNQSGLNFKVRSSPVKSPPAKMAVDSDFVGLFRYDSLNVYEEADVRVVVPRYALFSDVKFKFSREKRDSAALSDIFAIHQVYTPLSKAYILSIKPRNLKPGLEQKIMIAGITANGIWSSYRGNYKNGYVTALIKTFGRFFISADTLNPVIRPVNFVNGRKYADGQAITFRITDKESGILKYSGYIDEKWALFEYDAKNDLLKYEIDKNRLESGKMHKFNITVTDNRENVTHFPGSFYY